MKKSEIAVNHPFNDWLIGWLVDFEHTMKSKQSNVVLDPIDFQSLDKHS